eukprot:6018159-Alexandrium_andersonii.AAC.1
MHRFMLFSSSLNTTKVPMRAARGSRFRGGGAWLQGATIQSISRASRDCRTARTVQEPPLGAASP